MGDSSQIEPLLPEAGLALVLEVARDQLSSQLAQIGSLDTKLASTFGFASAVVAVASALLALMTDGLAVPVIVLLELAFVVYVIVLLVSVVAIWPRVFNYGPDLLDLWNRLTPDATAFMFTHLVAYALTDAFSYNERKVRFKERSATVA